MSSAFPLVLLIMLFSLGEIIGQTNYASFDFERAFNAYYLTSQRRDLIDEENLEIQESNTQKLEALAEMERQMEVIRLALEDGELTEPERLTLDLELQALEFQAAAAESERAESLDRSYQTLELIAEKFTQDLHGKILSVGDSVRSDLGFDDVFDTSGQGGKPLPSEVSAGDTVNVLEEVISRLNDSAPDPDPEQVNLAEVFATDGDSDGWPYGVELAVGSDPENSRDQKRRLLVPTTDGAIRGVLVGVDPSKQFLIRLRVTRSTGLSGFDQVLFETDSGGASLRVPMIEVLTIPDEELPASSAFYRLEAELREP